MIGEMVQPHLGVFIYSSAEQGLTNSGDPYTTKTF